MNKKEVFKFYNFVLNFLMKKSRIPTFMYTLNFLKNKVFLFMKSGFI